MEKDEGVVHKNNKIIIMSTLTACIQHNSGDLEYIHFRKKKVRLLVLAVYEIQYRQKTKNKKSTQKLLELINQSNNLGVYKHN